MKQSKLFIFASLFFILVFGILSCEVGLGEAVDTEVPVVKIQTPPMDAIIRGKFAVGGDWSDDGSLSKVEVVLKRNDKPGYSRTFSAGINKNTWSCLIEPLDGENKKNIPDGIYQIIVNMYDNGGHVSSETRLITIDNTAPIVVLDRPASKFGAELIDAYGQKLSILGRAADDNNVNKLEVTFTGEINGVKKTHKVVKDNVSNVIDEVVAIFPPKDYEKLPADNPNKIYYENYNEIYGCEKLGIVNYECTLVAFDNAQKYSEEYPIKQERSADDKLGNSVDYYYLYGDLSSNLLDKYSLTDLYKMLSGNYEAKALNLSKNVQESSGAENTESYKNPLEMLNDNKVLTGAFTINPENNPTFSVTGYNPISSDNSYDEENYRITNGSRLAVEIAPGIDGYSLNVPFEGNYVVNIYECKENTTEKNTEDGAKSFKLIPSESKYSGGTYKIYIPFDASNITKYSRYILEIEGEDSKGNQLIPIGGGNNKYVFDFVPSKIPPVLNITQNLNQYYKEDSKLVITGTVKAADIEPKIKFSFGNDETSTISPNYVLSLDSTSDTLDDNYYLRLNANQEYEFKYTFGKLPFENTGKKYLTVTADCGNNLKASRIMNFIFDKDKPCVNGNIEPESSNTNWCNTTQIYVKVSDVQDVGSGIAYVKAGVEGDLSVLTQKTKTVKENESSNVEKEVVYFDGYIDCKSSGKKDIVFEIADNAGNIITPASIKVNIDTDFPSANLVSVDDEYVNPELTQKQFSGSKLVNGKNDITVVIGATDQGDAGIKDVKLSKLSGNDISDVVVSTPKEGTSDYEIVISKDKLTQSGSGSVDFVITDNAGNATTLNAFTLNIDTEHPETTIRTPQDAFISSEDKDAIDVNGKIKLTGTSRDNNSVSKVQLQYSKDNGSSWVDYGNAITENPYNWEVEVDTTDTTKFGEGTPSIKFRALATDSAENITENPSDITVKINQDSDRPIVSLTTVAIAGNKTDNRANLKNSSTLYGMVSDDDGTVSKIEYSTDEGQNWTEIKNLSNGSWNIPKLEDGPVTLSFRVTESGGKVWPADDADKYPKIKGSDGKVIDSGKLYLRVDTQTPEKRNVQYAVKGYVEDEEINTFAEYEKFKKEEYIQENGKIKFGEALTTLGGIHSEFKMKLDAYDANGIAEVYAFFEERGENNKIKPNETKTVYAYSYEKDGIKNIVYSDVKVENNEAAAVYASTVFYEDYELKTRTDLPAGIIPKYIYDYNTYELTFPIGEMANGTYTLVYRVIDTAGLKNEGTVQVAIDKNAPKVDVTGPSSDTNASGSISVYGNVDSSSKLYYGIEAADSNLPAGLTKKVKNNVTYTQIKDASLSWFVYFDDKLDPSLTSTHSKNMNDHIKDLYTYKSSEINMENYEEITPVKFVIKAVDDVGNISTTYHIVMIDPQGDRPTVEISSPANKSTVGGIVKFYGTSLDLKGKTTETLGVKNIWLQLISDKNAGGNYYDEGNKTVKPFELTKKDLTLMKKIGGKIYNMKAGVEYTGTIDSILNPDEYAIKVNNETFNGSSWSYELNKDKKLDPESGTPINAVGVRVFAQDKDDKLSVGKDCLVLFDADKPVISDLYLENGSGQTLEYVEDMYIKGTGWKLKGTVKDKDKVKSVTVGGNGANMEPAGGAETVTFTYDLNMSGTGVGAKSFTIKAEDNTESGEPNIQTMEININYDNTAPSLLTEGEAGYDINKKVQQKNSFYTFGSEVTEEAIGGVNQSGFAYVAAYFVRPGKNSVFNPLLSYKGDGASNRVTSCDSMTPEDGLYWFEVSATQDNTAASVFTLENDNNPNIHVNSLVKINGAYYLIKSKSGTTITLDGNPKLGNKNTTIKIANAVIIDNTVQEAEGKDELQEDGYYQKPINDDGDRMIEGVSKTGATWTWQASICSRNIPDGPIEIHYVVFDKAGNSVSRVVNAKVENNAPRLAGLGIWTDYNRNGKFNQAEDKGELYTFYNEKAEREDFATAVTDNLVVSGNKKDSSNGGTAIRMIKEEFTLIPEIVGGNGNLFYTYKIGSGSESGVTALNITGRDDGIDENADGNGYLQQGNFGEAVIKGNKDARIKVTKDILNTLDNNDIGKAGWNNPTWFEYTIYDSTGDDAGSYANKNDNSLSAKFQVALNVQYKDSTIPKVTIDKFGWNGTGDGNNNLCWDEKTPLGHIELEKDLPSGTFGAGNSGLYDLDPKVSGKIKITGTAEDNIAIKTLKISFPGVTTGGKYKEVATYNENDGTWKTVSDTQNNKWSFTVEDASIEGENGDRTHKVNWTFTVDTTLAGVGTEKEFKIEAVDVRGIKQNNSGISGLVSEAGNYKMDVVPYITGVSTSLSSLKKNNPSSYSRTAKGHYTVGSPVRNSSEIETVIIAGFNLDNAKYGNNLLASASSADCVTGVGKLGTSFVKLPISSVSTTGYIELNVNEVPTLNNINNDNAKGAFTGELSASNYKDYAYNRQPNGDNNNNLTDDVYFDVWDIKPEAVSVKGAGNIAEPIMKINPINKMIGFAYANGPSNFSMANYSTDKASSYTLWQGNYARNISTGFTFDSNGYSHGITVGLDTNPSSKHAGRMTYLYSGWGVGSTESSGNYNGVNASRIDSIGINNDTFFAIEERFNSPSLATVIHGNDTYVYLAYYDDLKQEIRFKWGNLSKAEDEYDRFKENNGRYKGRGYTFNQFKDQSSIDVNLKTEIGGYGSDKAFDTDKKPESFSTIAGGNTKYNFGNYVSIAVVPGKDTTKDTVVLTWYDATLNAWMYSYKTNPNNDKDMGATGPGAWSTPIELKEGAGEYCKIAVDKSGGIHVAAKDTVSSDLVYAYLSSYRDTTPEVVTVDGGGLTGSYITLDVAIKDGYAVPYIGYYADSFKKPKVAYLENVISAAKDSATREAVKIPNGDIDEVFTGSWECSFIPTISFLRDDYINVGVWKNGNGIITDSTPTNEKTMKNTEDEGILYGNGTSYPVMGYATRVGTMGKIETAQMK